MVIFDILIYVFFAWLFYSIAKRSYYYSGDALDSDKYQWLFIGLFTVFAAIRWRVGVDSIGYAQSFVTGLTGHEVYGRNEETELAMYWLVHGIHDFGLHFSIGLGIMAFLQVFFITKALQEYRYIFMFVPIVMFGSCYYLDLMNGVRQMIVACGFLWASRFIVEKKPWHYFGYIVVAYFMHKSALMLIPFYFIPNQFKIADKRTIMLIVYTSCFIAGLIPQFQSVIQYAENLAMLAGYDGYADQVVEMMSGDYTEETHALGPMQLSYLFIGYFVIWFGPQLKEKYEEIIPYFNLWYIFAVFYGCAFFLVTNISHIFIRPVQYFELFQMVIAALILYDLYTDGVFTLKCKQIAILLTLTIWTSTCWKMYKVNRDSYLPGFTESASYKVFFMHMDEVNKLTGANN